MGELPSEEINELTVKQLGLIPEISAALAHRNVRWWLFGGWGLDARVGRITRSHHDLEFWVFHSDAAATRDALIAAGFEEVPVKHPEESYEFIKDGVDSSAAFIWARNPDGTFSVRGRWSDWRFPPNSFDAPPGRIDGMDVPAMSAQGMLAMKQQYPRLRNGRPLRRHDLRDIEILRTLID